MVNQKDVHPMMQQLLNNVEHPPIKKAPPVVEDRASVRILQISCIAVLALQLYQLAKGQSPAVWMLQWLYVFSGFSHHVPNVAVWMLHGCLAVLVFVICEVSRKNQCCKDLAELERSYEPNPSACAKLVFNRWFMRACAVCSLLYPIALAIIFEQATKDHLPDPIQVLGHNALAMATGGLIAMVVSTFCHALRPMLRTRNLFNSMLKSYSETFDSALMQCRDQDRVLDWDVLSARLYSIHVEQTKLLRQGGQLTFRIVAGFGSLLVIAGAVGAAVHPIDRNLQELGLQFYVCVACLLFGAVIVFYPLYLLSGVTDFFNELVAKADQEPLNRLQKIPIGPMYAKLNMDPQERCAHDRFMASCSRRTFGPAILGTCLTRQLLFFGTLKLFAYYSIIVAALQQLRTFAGQSM